MTCIDRDGNILLSIIITQRLIKLPECDPVALSCLILTRIGVPIITVQFIIRVVVIEGRIYIQGLRICRKITILNINYINVLTRIGFLILLCIPNRICFSPVTAPIFILVYSSITGICIEAGFSSILIRTRNRQNSCSSAELIFPVILTLQFLSRENNFINSILFRNPHIPHIVPGLSILFVGLCFYHLSRPVLSIIGCAPCVKINLRIVTCRDGILSTISPIRRIQL